MGSEKNTSQMASAAPHSLKALSCNGSGYGNGRRKGMHTPRTGEGMRSLQLPGSIPGVNRQSCPLDDPLQQCGDSLSLGVSPCEPTYRIHIRALGWGMDSNHVHLFLGSVCLCYCLSCSSHSFSISRRWWWKRRSRRGGKAWQSGAHGAKR